MNNTTYPTGETCDGCDAPSYFVPGYLTSTNDGAKHFTVARETTHADKCSTLRNINKD